VPQLTDLVEVKLKFADADFWLVRRGTPAEVGRPVRTYNPEHVGVRVRDLRVLDPNYLFYVLMALHAQGYWRARAVGTLRLVNIRAQDVKAIPLG
jgi:hypothetical protein